MENSTACEETKSNAELRALVAKQEEIIQKLTAELKSCHAHGAESKFERPVNPAELLKYLLKRRLDALEKCRVDYEKDAGRHAGHHKCRTTDGGLQCDGGYDEIDSAYKDESLTQQLSFVNIH
jgi:hypothetical protein